MFFVIYRSRVRKIDFQSFIFMDHLQVHVHVSERSVSVFRLVWMSGSLTNHFPAMISPDKKNR